MTMSAELLYSLPFTLNPAIPPPPQPPLLGSYVHVLSGHALCTTCDVTSLNVTRYSEDISDVTSTVTQYLCLAKSDQNK